MSPGLHEVRAERGKVRLTTRFWDGIDKPEITALESLAPAQARAWADRLRAAADEADGQERDQLAARRSALDEKRKVLERDLASVDAELDRLGRPEGGAG